MRNKKLSKADILKALKEKRTEKILKTRRKKTKN